MATQDTIASAIKTLVETLTGEPTVIVRDEMVRMEGDTLPLIIITKGGERTIERYSGNSIRREYEIVLTFLGSQNHVLESSLGTLQTWRDSVKKRVEPDDTVTPPILPAATMVYDIRTVDLPAEDRAAKAAGYDRVQLGLLVYTSEDTHA